MPNINASAKHILELAKSIGVSVKKMEILEDDLENKLSILRRTFQDDGYEVIKNHIEKTKNELDTKSSAVKIVMETLIEYARKIIDSDETM